MPGPGPGPFPPAPHVCPWCGAGPGGGGVRDPDRRGGGGTGEIFHRVHRRHREVSLGPSGFGLAGGRRSRDAAQMTRTDARSYRVNRWRPEGVVGGPSSPGGRTGTSSGSPQERADARRILIVLMPTSSTTSPSSAAFRFGTRAQALDVIPRTDNGTVVIRSWSGDHRNQGRKRGCITKLDSGQLLIDLCFVDRVLQIGLRSGGSGRQKTVGGFATESVPRRNEWHWSHGWGIMEEGMSEQPKEGFGGRRVLAVVMVLGFWASASGSAA